jgi:kynurenine formamidase
MFGIGRRHPRSFAVALGTAGLVLGTVLGLGISGLGAALPKTASKPGAAGPVAGFSKIVYLSHMNNPRKTPGFPGDPRFYMTTAFTVPKDGYYLHYVREGEHTGTHWGAPCHFHVNEVCAGKLRPTSLVLPAVVIDIRAQTSKDVDYRATVADMKAWIAQYGPMPKNAAVILRTGCDRFWGPDSTPTHRTYYNCGSGRRGLHQPGFSLRAVRWLIRRGILGDRGALGTDTFGPDPGTDEAFRESSAVFHRHRIDLENMTHLGRLPARGGWVVVGGPRNVRGSGSPATIFGFVP